MRSIYWLYIFQLYIFSFVSILNPEIFLITYGYERAISAGQFIFYLVCVIVLGWSLWSVSCKLSTPIFKSLYSIRLSRSTSTILIIIGFLGMLIGALSGISNIVSFGTVYRSNQITSQISTFGLIYILFSSTCFPLINIASIYLRSFSKSLNKPLLVYRAGLLIVIILFYVSATSNNQKSALILPAFVCVFGFIRTRIRFSGAISLRISKIIAVFVLPLMVYLSLAFVFNNKSLGDQGYTILQYIKLVIGRVSTHAYSFFVFTAGDQDLQQFSPLTVLYHRICTLGLLDGCASVNTRWLTSSAINYLNTYKSATLYAGSSPGLLASVFLTSGFLKILGFLSVAISISAYIISFQLHRNTFKDFVIHKPRQPFDLMAYGLWLSLLNTVLSDSLEIMSIVSPFLPLVLFPVSSSVVLSNYFGYQLKGVK